MKYYVCYEFNCVCYSVETTKESLLRLQYELIEDGIHVKYEEEQEDESGPYTITYYLKNFNNHWQVFAYGVAVD